MRRFCCFSSVVILTFIFALFLSGRDFAESALTNQNDQKSTHLTWLSLLLGKKTVSDIIKDVDKNDYSTETEVVTDEYGRKIALTKMMIVFKPYATPLQFEQLLDRLNAIVTCSIAGARSVVIRIPQPDSLADYYAILAEIESESFVDFVWMGEIPELQALPSNFYSEPPTTNELPHIDNHLAIRGAAAWNAKGAIDSSYEPRVVVADSFGEGDPENNTINYTLPVGIFQLGQWDGGHGYGVLGVIAATHGQYYSTGIYPKKISLRVIDYPSEVSSSSNNLIFAEIMDKLLIALTRTTSNVVVNTSMGYGCDGTGGDCIDINDARNRASWWIEEIRRFGLESRVFHATAAGNIEPIEGAPGLIVRDARTKSPFASAALLNGLSDGSGGPMPNLTNTVVIENAVNTSINGEPITTKCLQMDSFIGGNLSGIGTYVRSFVNHTGDETSIATGTSFATPQVAGLAAYLWGINHTLTPQQIRNIIITTSSNSVPVINDQECSDWGAPAPIIDAYEALLALDAVSAQNSVNSPVRFSVLDVNGDKSFDENDLQLFVDKYYDTSGAEPVLLEPIVPDYSRYDLNGDGWTGGSKTASFDLDRIGSIQYGMPNISNNITQDIEGTAVNFNETLVRDKDMLCYYAYSTFYSGDQVERQNLLGDKCPTSGTCADRGLPGPETVMWQGREWQRCEYYNGNESEPFFDGKMSYWSAINYCDNLELGGHSDWRLPTKDELKSLVVCSNGTPTPLQDKETEYPFTTYSCGVWGTYVTPTIDPSFSVMTSVGYYHWSVTEAHQANLAWSVDFGAGTCVYEDKTWLGYTRCVR